MNGLELFDELQRDANYNTLLFTTRDFPGGHGDIPLVVPEVAKQGAIDFLEKPADHRSLIDAISRALQSDHSARLAFETQAEILREIVDFDSTRTHGTYRSGCGLSRQTNCGPSIRSVQRRSKPIGCISAKKLKVRTSINQAAS